MTKPVRRAFWLVIGAAIVAAVIWMLRPAPVPVDTARADRGRVQETIDEDGETRVRERFVVSSPINGRLRRVALREGDAVEKGRVVAMVEPAPLDARAREEGEARLAAAIDAQRVARAQHEAAKAAVEQAQRDRDRAVDLAGRGLVADEAREKAELALTTARQELDAATHRASAAAHEVEMARAAIAEGPIGTRAIELKAPASGCVLRRAEESERVILAGSTVMEIGDVCSLEIVVDLLSTDAVHVAKGDTVEVREWGRDSTLVAIVDRVEPSGFTKTSALGVEEQRVNVVAVLSNPPRELGDRFRVGVRVVLWRAENILRAPRGAVFQAGDEWRVFVVAGGRARERGVTLGHRGDDYVEVRGGIEEGDVVVMYPDERVRDGVRARAQESR